MAKNATTDDESTTAVDDSTKVSDEEAIRDLKYPKDDVETSTEEDETSEDTGDEDATDEAGDEDGKTDEDTEDADSEEDDKTDSDEEPTEFIKEFPNIKGDNLPDYARELEKTVKLSNTEGKRLSDRVKELETELANKGNTDDTAVGETDKKDTTKPQTATEAYMEQKMKEEIDASFKEFQKSYPQAVPGSAEYDTFTKEVAVLARVIKETQGRFASPKELYNKAAVSLGWEPETTPTSKDKLKIALKDNASISKTTSTTKKVPKSKVTDQMIAVNRMMYPGKSDDEIRKELEPHIQ